MEQHSLSCFHLNYHLNLELDDGLLWVASAHQVVRHLAGEKLGACSRAQEFKVFHELSRKKRLGGEAVQSRRTVACRSEFFAWARARDGYAGPTLPAPSTSADESPKTVHKRARTRRTRTVRAARTRGPGCLLRPRAVAALFPEPTFYLTKPAKLAV